MRPYLTGFIRHGKQIVLYAGKKSLVSQYFNALCLTGPNLA